MKKAWLYLENGVFLEAKSFGSEGTKTGEIVFNTSLSGYQEIATDPSYAGQFVTFTMSEIGNVGVNDDDMESRSVFCKGVIVRSYNELYSNFRAQGSFGELLKKYGAMGISDIDTRYLTKLIRDNGAMMMVVSTEVCEKEELKKILENSPRIEQINYIDEVSTKEVYTHETGIWDEVALKYKEKPAGTKKIVALDFGIKRNILNELVSAGFSVEVQPNSFAAEPIIKRYKNGEIVGVFLSNGPGDPLIMTKEVAEIKKLLEAEIPMFGICLGHQLLSIAHGYPTYKLKFGHHGGNHPVKELDGNCVMITSQNHNYSVPDNIVEIAEPTHKNLFDGTIEGVSYKGKKVFSVQHHPEASPGPKESENIFKKFAEMLNSDGLWVIGSGAQPTAHSSQVTK